MWLLMQRVSWYRVQCEAIVCSSEYGCQLPDSPCKFTAKYAIITIPTLLIHVTTTLFSLHVCDRSAEIARALRLKHVNYLSCLAEIRGNFTYLSEGVSKNKRCWIFRRNTVVKKVVGLKPHQPNSMCHP